MTAAFSSNCEAVFQRVADVAVAESVALENLEELYQIQKTCDFIKQHHFSKVALQFPDELLVDSVAVSAAIESETGAKLYILADTSYGSCCVDEVAAEHVGAQGLVHYGRACLSPCERMPLMYVFQRRALDLEACAAAFRDLYPDTQSHVVVLYDVSYAHAIDDLLAILYSVYPNIVGSTLLVDQCDRQEQNQRPNCDPCGPNHDGDHIVRQFGRRFALKTGSAVKDYGMFYIGQEGATLRNIMITWNRCSFCTFDPDTATGRTESMDTDRTLAKRFYLIERAKDASVVGILVGTLGVADYLSIIQQLKETIRRAGKKSYLFAMGKLNVAKLANFLEIDIYVLIACPENSLLDSRDFYKPVVTPFEMEMACNGNREWSEEYVTDFRHLLPGGKSHVPLPSEDDDSEEADMSLVTGALRSRRPPPPLAPGPSSSVVLRNQALTMANTASAASFLSGRSWQGLEQKLGENPVVKAVAGRKGIAIAYEDEGSST